MNTPEFKNIIHDALREDLGFGDLSGKLFPDTHRSTGIFTMKEDGILSGINIITEAYACLEPAVEVTTNFSDGDTVSAGDPIARAEGATAALLAGERVILNFLQHLSGIATETNRAVRALADMHTQICDTRKTLPGLRMLQKYAVRCGGGVTHRYRLDAGVMIKDNHISAAGSIQEAVDTLRKSNGPMVRIEVETESAEQVQEAIDAGADIIMFDNRSPDEVARFVKMVPDSICTEASGGITLQTLPDYRGTGVDYISLGYLTHTVSALDISFNLEQ